MDGWNTKNGPKNDVNSCHVCRPSLLMPYSLSLHVESNKGAKVETPIHDSIRELVTWECKEHAVKS
jgi:hypothetical protein